MDGALFISYSHQDAAWMEQAKQHLQGLLHERCLVWTDGEIPPGSSWEHKLLANLNQASAALVLASPDYLVSPWCRRELKQLHRMRKGGQLAAVYWMLLRPCGWQRSELAELQALQTPATSALTDLPEGNPRDHELLRCCDRVATDLLRGLKTADAQVTMVRELLATNPNGANLTVHSVMAKEGSSQRGDFAIVCLGNKDSGEQVVIKVLVNTPLHRLRQLFFDVSCQRARIQNPSAIPTEQILTIGEGYAQRIVIVSEFARGTSLARVMADDAQLPAGQRALDLDTIGRLLRRVAELLHELHQLEPVEVPGGESYVHVMGPLVPQNIFYDVRSQRPQVALLGVTNFLWYFFDPVTFRRMVNPSSGTYELPAPLHAPAPDSDETPAQRAQRLQQADQFFLGMLALELLEGRNLYIVGEKAEAVQPRSILERLPRPAWALRHEQLFRIVDRLLQVDPAARYDNMAQVLGQLRSLEESARALAKASFLQHVAPPDDPGHWFAFAQAFYDHFFDLQPDARAVFVRARGRPAEEAAHFRPDRDHHMKLLNGLKAVLNFRPGGQPSAIDGMARSHVGYGIPATHLQTFAEAFLKTLSAALLAAGTEEALATETVAAWQTLFAPVVAEMGAALQAAKFESPQPAL